MALRKTILFVMMTLALVSCGKSSDSSNEESSSEGVTTASTTDITDNSSVPNLALTFETNVEFINLTNAQESKMLSALDVLKLVVGTDEFKERVLNHKYNGKKTFVDNNGLTNAQIYQKLLEGAEKLQPAKNNTVDMEVEMYTASTNVVGYTYSTSKRVWVNTKYFNSYTSSGVARNLIHEWLHKLGFGHSASATASRPYSVPYGIGSIMGDIANDFL